MSLLYFYLLRELLVDCYDGEDGEPIVYHANTWTKAITLHEILSAIETQAFAVSP